jgi:xylose isomerase
MFFLVHLLETQGYDGPRHFDAHAYRTEDEQGVWDFAAGCMRTYNILKEKSKRYQADAEIQGLLKEISQGNAEHAALFSGGYSKEAAAKLKATHFDVDALARRGYQYEKLDQLVVDLLLGVR